MRYFLTTILLFNLVFFLGCKTTSEEKPTVSSSPSQPVEEPEEEVEEGKPQSIVVPISSLGDVSETRKQILQNTLEDELKTHFRLISQEKFEEAQEKAFQELDYEECTEDRCIILIQEMLQVEIVFHLQVIGEGEDTQLSLSWRTLDEKRKETDVCMGCGTFQLNDKVGGLVEKLVGVKEEVVVKEEPPKKVEPVVVETPKVVPKVVQEPVVQKIEKDKTKGMFVTVGKSGTILTSSNGTSWTERNSGTSEPLHGVTYGNGIFVTVGGSGTIITSSNGTSWTQRNSGTSDSLRDITYGNGIFVTVGGYGIILTSSNGTSWTERNSGTSEPLHGVNYGKRLFVIVGSSRTILTSTDGTSWTKRNSGIYKELYGVNYGNGIFVTVGESGTILTSSNGTSWNERTSGTSKSLYGVTYSQ